MSKFLNLFAPIFGCATLVLGIAYGVATNFFANSKIQTAEQKIQFAKADSVRLKETADMTSNRVAELEIKVSELEGQINITRAQTADEIVTERTPRHLEKFNLGREALAEEIAAWDVDVLPDGRGLPHGRGNVITGEQEFSEHCASCHGEFAEGIDNWPVLAGGFDTLADRDPVKTVGSYWPYLSTVWDYIHRSMPFGAAQTLSTDQVYSMVAYILYSNDLVDEDFELSHENFNEFGMYNVNGFIIDDRSESEYPLWRKEPCMIHCKDQVEITMRATVLDVTPQTDTFIEIDEKNVRKIGDSTININPEIIADGENAFRKCRACHQIGVGASHKIGPHLNNILGRTIGGFDDFKYSSDLRAAAEGGRIWDNESMIAFLTKPKDYFKNTKMAFVGFKQQEEIEALIAYMRSYGTILE
ncbi:MAG: c-type cytochrome [Aestuariivita sp.]|nr:c-type cytochrome [Aestuariivita sp.]